MIGVSTGFYSAAGLYDRPYTPVGTASKTYYVKRAVIAGVMSFKINQDDILMMKISTSIILYGIAGQKFASIREVFSGSGVGIKNIVRSNGNDITIPGTRRI